MGGARRRSTMPALTSTPCFVKAATICFGPSSGCAALYWRMASAFETVPPLP
jgi:hypothetical protein